MSFLILFVFLGAAAAAVPIAHALLVAALAAAASSDRVPLDILVQTMVQQVQSFPLIAIPFFMLTGSLMMGGKLGEALIGVLSSVLGRYHGGPAQVGVLSSTIFGVWLGGGRCLGHWLAHDSVAQAHRLPACVFGGNSGCSSDH
jgi:TRAP-type transport system large permease protein